MSKRKRSYMAYIGRVYGTAYTGRGSRRAPLYALLGIACLLITCGSYFFLTHVPENGREPDAQGNQDTVSDISELPAQPENWIFPERDGFAAKPAFKVRGIYVTAWSAGIADRMAHYIELCDTTEINALVIDVKDDRGQITFLNNIDGASGASVNIIPDIDKTMSLLKSHGIYTIARVVCFKDPVWSRLNPELAIHNAQGAVWKDGGGGAWLNPYDRAAWDYIAAVAMEAARLGFDEIQLDYVRFPSDGKLREIDYGSAAKDTSKAQAIAEFLTYIKTALEEDYPDIKLSADVFGIIALSRGDAENIGQDLELLLLGADYICPMVYPSHFANKRQNGKGQEINGILFEAPDLQPYEVICNTLLLLRRRFSFIESDAFARVRPYLQDFTASYLGSGYYQPYGAEQVLEQIRAVHDAGFDEWILWNASGVYSEDAFVTE